MMFESQEPHPGQETALWYAGRAPHARPTLDSDTTADICIVGAGIAGLATAYELLRQGKSVIVLDAAAVAGGETGRSSAHVSNVIDDRYFKIERVHGARAAAMCYESHTAAIQWLAQTIEREKIACAFERLDGYLFTPAGESSELLELELAAARRAGFADAERIEHLPWFTSDMGACLRFPNQAQCNPLALAAGLADAVERSGGRIYCNTRMHKVDGNDQPIVHCANGVTVSAAAVIIATNSPVNDVVTLHTKQHAYRSYAVALSIPRNTIPRALYWDTSQRPGDVDGPYHYVRLFDDLDQSGVADPNHELLIVGGEDHKTGQDHDGAIRWARLEAWAHERFGITGSADFRWSGQIMEPVDYVAFIGRNPTGPKNVFVVTGDSGMGITHGAIAAMLLPDLIRNRPNDWERLYDPGRQTLRTAWNYASENLNTAAQYADWIMPGDVKSVAEIAPGEGALVRDGLRLLACYRDSVGDLHACSAACPHLGGVVQWNPAEHTWDCPCHGSRFDGHGDVLNGPAVTPLAVVHDAPRNPFDHRTREQVIQAREMAESMPLGVHHGQ